MTFSTPVPDTIRASTIIRTAAPPLFVFAQQILPPMLLKNFPPVLAALVENKIGTDETGAAGD
jgi:hypothetical protein